MESQPPITIQIFNAEVTPENISERAAEVISILAQGLLMKVSKDESDQRTHSPARHRGTKKHQHTEASNARC